MFRIDNASADASLPSPAAAGTQGYWTNGNPGTGSPPTIIDGDWLNRVQEEICSIIAAQSAITLSKTAYNQLGQAILSGAMTYALDSSGTANTITAALPIAPVSLTQGLEVNVKIANTNTGASQMNLNGMGLENITLKGAVLPSNALIAGLIAKFSYDISTTSWQLLSVYGAGSSIPGSSITGTNHTFATADNGSLIERSNSGTNMADTLPGTSGALVNGWNTFVKITDASASDTISVGAGGTLNQGNLTGPIIALPGETWFIESAGGGVYNAGRIHSAVLHAAPPEGAFSICSISWASNTTVNSSIGYLILSDSNNNTRRVMGITPTLNSATSGANGLDTGSISANTWYYIFIIFNPTTNTSAVLMSLSSTAPTLPSGYTFKAPISAVRTDGSSNFIGFTQSGRDWQYKVGNNLSALPIIISGAQGSISTPTWVGTSVANFVPSTGTKIKLCLIATDVTNGMDAMAAPNPNYGAITSTSNPPPMVVYSTGGNSGGNIMGELILESADIYYVGTGIQNLLTCVGFTLNL